MAKTAIVCFLVFTISTCTLGSLITIENNGYKGIVVAFSPEMSETEGYPLISKIQDLFKSGSKALFSATRKRAYFHGVTILVPQSWETKSNYQPATSENFGQADIRVDVPNPTYGDGPYTLQVMPCSNAGEYIHLTPDYLKNLDTTSTSIFGDPGRTLVHEWAHLRYGIFDEFGQPPYFPAAYYDSTNQEYVPNSCANSKLHGRYWNPIKKRECIFENNHTPEPECVFEPDLNNTATASIASYHFLPEMQVFCDDKDHPHNRRANNKHNLMCDGRSTWNIISSNDDFSEKNPAMDQIPNLEPDFTIVQEMENTFSVVLDVSGSMDAATGGYSRLQMAKDVLQRWLKDDVKTGTAVGVVWFSSTSDYQGTMRLIADESDRQALINELPPKTIGSTCIGCGLSSGMKQLQTYRKRSGGDIILLTDGEENVRPFIQEVIPQLKTSQVRVVTIAFTRQAGEKLMNLSQETNGKAYFVEEGNVGGLADAFYDAITYQTVDFNLPVKVMEKVYETAEKEISGSFVIDETIGNSTVVDFQYFKTNDIKEVKITGPNVDVSTNDNRPPEEVEDDKLTRNIKFRFKLLKPGKYNYNINRTGDPQQKITVVVKSKASAEGVNPIITRSWAEATTYENKPAFVIFAEVKQGNKPVLNASVVAMVDIPNKPSKIIQLFDNGLVADITRDDGIYSRYLLYYGKGKYAVKAQVVSNGEASIQEFGFIASQAMPISSRYLGALNVTFKPAGNFERSAAGGALEQTTNEDAEVNDIYPPNKIQDLTVSDYNNKNLTIELQWTAPGDDIDYGNASYYELRYSTSWDELFDHFDNCKNISLNLKPLPAGQTEAITIHSPDSNLHKEQTFFFALKAYDDQKLASRMSNIADVTLDPESEMETTTPEMETTTISGFETTTKLPVTSRPHHHGGCHDDIVFMQREKMTYLRIPTHHHHHHHYDDDDYDYDSE